MIDTRKKAQAIARIKALEELETISEEMNIPLLLLQEWESNLDDRDLTTVQANVLAAGRVLTGELVEGSERLLKQRLEEAACEIAMRAHQCAGSGDIVYATSLDKCASAVSKLYATMVAKVGSDNPIFQPSATSRSLFQIQMKD